MSEREKYKGRRRSGHERDLGAITWFASIAAGLVLTPFAWWQLITYSPYENPAAGTRGLLLALAIAFLIGIPGLILVIRVIALLAREHAALAARLTPVQRAWLYWGEAAGLLGAHLLIRHHQKEVSRELTDSVMGDRPEPE